jgi:hypothetical protein
MSTDAVISAAAYLERDWGHGRFIVSVESGPDRSAILECGHGDGSRWYIAATRWGNTMHADTREEIDALLAAKVASEREATA